MGESEKTEFQTKAFARLEEKFKDIYLIEDPGIVKLICATVVAHRLPSDPVWLFIVAPSSGGKTELINAIQSIDRTYSISTLTPNTFISGQKKTGEETSLLMKLKDNVVTIKDFTTILSMNEDGRREIMAQLREIYDGEYTKEFGSGKRVQWRGKISMIAGTTTSIYTSRAQYASMGERFIMYAPIIPDREEVTRRSVRNTYGMTEKREGLREAFRRYVDEEVKIPQDMPRVPTSLEEELIQLAEMATRARSPVERDGRSFKKEMTFVHDAEMPPRFASQLIVLASALMVMNGDHKDIPDTDRHILYKISLDSIDKIRRIVMQKLTRYRRVATKTLAMDIGYPTDLIRRNLEDLNVLGLVDRFSVSGNKDEWEMRDKYRQIMSKFDKVEMLDATLVDVHVEEVEESQEEYMEIITLDEEPLDEDVAAVNHYEMIQAAEDILGGHVISATPAPGETPNEKHPHEEYKNKKDSLINKQGELL